jgi:AraC-like DNA-binding protein
MAQELCATTYDFIAACLRPCSAHPDRADPTVDTVWALRAKRFIVCNIEQDLSIDRICRDLGVSRRTLYRLFEPLGGVHAYIRERRLDNICRVLRSGVDPRPISEIAAQHRFKNRAVFWRAFRSRYGVTPADVRASGGAPSPRTPVDQSNDPTSIAPWIDHLRH